MSTVQKRIRPTKDKNYLAIAKAVSERSTCLRRAYGAVIVKNDEIVSTGYNGSPRGEANCCDLGYCEREAKQIPHGERYELCRSVHAEQNAIISASRKDIIGATLYLYGYDFIAQKTIDAEPCCICARFIKNAGIARVVASKEEKPRKSFSERVVSYTYFDDNIGDVNSIQGILVSDLIKDWYDEAVLFGPNDSIVKEFKIDNKDMLYELPDDATLEDMMSYLEERKGAEAFLREGIQGRQG